MVEGVRKEAIHTEKKNQNKQNQTIPDSFLRNIFSTRKNPFSM